MIILRSIWNNAGPIFYLFPIIIYAICKLKNKNIKLEEGFATFEFRAVAYVIDFGLILLFDFLIKLIYSKLSSPPPIAPILLSMLFSFTNMIIIPTITGWSIGKRVVGIQLVKKDKKKAEFFDVIYREIVKGFISVPIIYLGCLWMLFGEGKLTWHDGVADIRVVKISASS